MQQAWQLSSKWEKNKTAQGWFLRKHLCDIFSMFCALEEGKQTYMGFPLWAQTGWVGLLHVSTSLLQHLLPLTFRPTPHTLLLSGCYMQGATVTDTRPLWQGISPTGRTCSALSLCIVVHLAVCALPGDSQSCRLRRKNKAKSEYLKIITKCLDHIQLQPYMPLICVFCVVWARVGVG